MDRATTIERLRVGTARNYGVRVSLAAIGHWDGSHRLQPNVDFEQLGRPSMQAMGRRDYMVSLSDSKMLGTLRGVCPMTVPIVTIIDDDEALCSSLVDLMRSVGYQAESFLSVEAFLVSKASSFDCIISDIHMPGMGGFDLIRKLREKGTMTPVIFITALRDKHFVEEADSLGALCLLRKPFKPGALLDAVERSLSSPPESLQS
jgi:CheY-like chemotaxis protein